jgi:hypothetical protein
VKVDLWLIAAKREFVHFKTALGLLRIPEKEGRAPQLSDGVYAFFQPDVQTLRPDVRQMIDAVFASLDRGGKGYLTPDELAWAVQLSPEERINTAAAWQVIERSVRASPTATDGAVINAATTNSPVVPDQLCPDFFSAQQIAANRARLFALEQANPSLAALVPPNPLVDAKALVKLLMVMDRRSAKNCCCSVESSGGSKQQQPFPQEAQLTPSPNVDVSAQLRCFHAYLNQRVHTKATEVSLLVASCHDGGSNSGTDTVSGSSNDNEHIRVTPQAFEHYVAHQLMMHPGEGAVWLASVRAALLDETNVHPTRDLLLRMTPGNGLYDHVHASMARNDSMEGVQSLACELLTTIIVDRWHAPLPTVQQRVQAAEVEDKEEEEDSSHECAILCLTRTKTPSARLSNPSLGCSNGRPDGRARRMIVAGACNSIAHNQFPKQTMMKFQTRFV